MYNDAICTCACMHACMHLYLSMYALYNCVSPHIIAIVLVLAGPLCPDCTLSQRKVPLAKLHGCLKQILFLRVGVEPLPSLLKTIEPSQCSP